MKKKSSLSGLPQETWGITSCVMLGGSRPRQRRKRMTRI